MDDELLFRAATGRTTTEEDATVDDWLALSPANEQRYRDTMEILRLTADADDALAFGRAPDAASILARRDGTRPWWSRQPGGRTWRAFLVPAAAVLAVALALPLGQHFGGGSAGVAFSGAFGPDEFVTEAEPATVGLRDGSVVRLAPASRLRVHTRQDNTREVSLAGRGFFAVTSDPEQPFTVHSDVGTITVLGTRFDVNVTGEDLHLIVIEGSVRLTVRGAQVVVRAGQLAQVLKGNLVPPVDVPDPASLIGWVGDFSAFHGTPLNVVAKEIEQRYDIRVELSEPGLGERTVTALFAGRSFEEIVEVICVVTNLRCSLEGDVLKMTPAR